MKNLVAVRGEGNEPWSTNLTKYSRLLKIFVEDIAMDLLAAISSKEIYVCRENGIPYPDWFLEKERAKSECKCLHFRDLVNEFLNDRLDGVCS